MVFAFTSCTQTPTSTVTTKLGKTTIEEIQANTGYVWYQTGYDAYPDRSDTTFTKRVSEIKSSMDTSIHSVLMIIKPTCSCQTTQLYMPQVMKTLDQAGFPHDRIDIYVTDARLAGIPDSIKTKYNINSAPVFLVLRNGVQKSAIIDNPEGSKTVPDVLAEGFEAP
jgi:hypothetical protein